MSPEPTDKREEEINPRAKFYTELIEGSLDKLESVELTSDGAVEIKRKEGEPIIYKSPRELFVGGENAQEQCMQQGDLMGGICGSSAVPTFLKIYGDLTWADCNDEKSRLMLKKNLEIVFTVAANGFNSDQLGKFVGLKDSDFSSREEAFLNLSDQEIAKYFRISNFDSYLGRFGTSPDQIAFFSKIKTENPDLFRKFVDYSLRKCLSSGHETAISFFELLANNPEVYDQLDQVHKDFSLPWLFERDCYNRLFAVEGRMPDGEEKVKRMTAGYKGIFKKIGLDANEIQKRLKDLGSERKYCPKFFEK